MDGNRRTSCCAIWSKEHSWSRVLVFVATQYRGRACGGKALQAGIYAAPFHGGLSQRRNQVLQGDERWRVVVTADLAALVSTIAQLPAVVNSTTCPALPWTILHRIGRTSRTAKAAWP